MYYYYLIQFGHFIYLLILFLEITQKSWWLIFIYFLLSNMTHMFIVDFEIHPDSETFFEEL